MGGRRRKFDRKTEAHTSALPREKTGGRIGGTGGCRRKLDWKTEVQCTGKRKFSAGEEEEGSAPFLPKAKKRKRRRERRKRKSGRQRIGAD